MVPGLKQLVLEDLMRMRSAPADDKGNEENKVQNKIDQ